MEKRVFDAFGKGWEALKPKMGIMIGTMVLAMVIYLIPYGAGYGLIFNDQAALGGLLILASYALMAFLSVGMIRVALNVYAKKEATIAMLFSGQDVALRFFGAMILYGVLVMLGTILLIIPGIYLALKYMYVPFLIIDKNMGIKEAFTKSGEITKGYKWHLFAFGIGVNIISSIAAIPMGLGLIIALPWTVLAYVATYKILMGEEKAAAMPTPVAPVA